MADSALDELDSIVLSGLEVFAFHGVFDFERAQGQKFFIDATVWLDTAAAAAGDDLAETVHYGILAERLHEAAITDPVDLIETLAERLAQVALAFSGVQATRITVHKPDAPIPHAFEDVAVSILRRKVAVATVATAVPEDAVAPVEVSTEGASASAPAPTSASAAPTSAPAAAPTPAPEPVLAILALGSNLGDRRGILSQAIANLDSLPKLRVCGVARLYESIALTSAGFNDDAPGYLNTAVQVETSLTPAELLEVVNAIEAAYGRVRLEHWGDRTLDIDIIAMGEVAITTEALTIPHAHAAERDFVLAPWHDLDPAAWLPGHGRVAELLSESTPSAHVISAPDEKWWLRR